MNSLQLTFIVGKGTPMIFIAHLRLVELHQFLQLERIMDECASRMTSAETTDLVDDILIRATTSHLRFFSVACPALWNGERVHIENQVKKYVLFSRVSRVEYEFPPHRRNLHGCLSSTTENG
jgi:hypothetical protein